VETRLISGGDPRLRRVSRDGCAKRHRQLSPATSITRPGPPATTAQSTIGPVAAARVSIVTATYNRSNVLRLAIETVRWQTLADWELLVVGDGCTDDTPEVVAAFGDDRIRFVNLDVNHGEQSAPNNAGIALATGRYLAFLNHDDLWFPDHLTVLIESLERTGADLVYGLSARRDAAGGLHLWGDSPGGRYEIWHSVPASLWLMRRELAERVGPWSSARRLWDAPSQHWLRRAHAAGGRLLPVPHLSVVQITSGGRRDSYKNRDSAEHEAAFAGMRDYPHERERLLTLIAATSSSMTTYVRPMALAGRALKALAARLAVAAGVAPVAVFSAIRYGRRGGFIRHLRRTRGLAARFGDDT
jgi:GT2 family glycosyltransferase